MTAPAVSTAFASEGVHNFSSNRATMVDKEVSVLNLLTPFHPARGDAMTMISSFFLTRRAAMYSLPLYGSKGDMRW
jgi:hypothetical protein